MRVVGLTGKELFNWEYLEPMFKNTPTPTGDIVTTVTALTARNPTLLGMLRDQCGPVPVTEYSTGATRATVLGSITPGASRLELPPVPSAPLRQLRVVHHDRG
ncbi:hypothetical protein [Nocardia altamirensis]|uniref:hypothetical protein n=1 Tax=Nocardia altamirensis TaxID=472158 RepID=UPI000840750C|nr:hypothetical protein [Nocardia altamirensis]